MPGGRTLDPDGNLWDLIAVELRRQREQHGDSLAAIGELWGRERSTVAHVENGRAHLQEAHAVKLDERWDTRGLFKRLVRFAKAGHEKEWFQAHLEFEAKAVELRIWELHWIPGIVQIEGYIRGALESSGLQDVDEHVAVRLKRQEALFGRKIQPLIWIYLDQSVIERPVGGPAVLTEQLARLLELLQLPNVSIRVMPTSVGAHVGLDGSFKIMTTDADSVYVEACGGGRLVEEAREVRSYRVRFDRIGDRAHRVDESTALIKQVMEGLT